MIRLDKLTAQAANMTRSQAVAAIKKGRVSVDGAICRVPDQKVQEQAVLLLDGQPVTYEKYVYLMMDKPAGYLSATEDTRDPSVTELLPEALQKRSLGIVGRLDKDTTGLLLLTDNGELNHRLTSPRYHMDKVYLATLDVPAEARDIRDFAEGMDLGDFVAMPGRLEIDPDDGRNCRVTIREGKFHQVKRMFRACGKTVVALRRISIGGVSLDDTLGSGGWRRLTESERKHLLENCGLIE